MVRRVSIVWGALVVGGLCWTGCAEGVSPGRDSGWVAGSGASWGGSGGEWEDTDGSAELRHDDLSPSWSIRLGSMVRPEIDAAEGAVIVLDPDRGEVTSYAEDGNLLWSTNVPPATDAAVAGDSLGGATVVAVGRDGQIWIHRLSVQGTLEWSEAVPHGESRPSIVAVENLGSGGVVVAFDDGASGPSQLVFTDPNGERVMQRQSVISDPIRGLQAAEDFVVGYGQELEAAAFDEAGDVVWTAELGMQVLSAWSHGDRVVTAGWVGGATCSFEHTRTIPDYAGKELPDYDPVAATADGDILSLDGDLLRGSLGWGHTWSFVRPGMTPVRVVGSRSSSAAFVLLESDDGSLSLDFIELMR